MVSPGFWGIRRGPRDRRKPSGEKAPGFPDDPDVEEPAGPAGAVSPQREHVLRGVGSPALFLSGRDLCGRRVSNHWRSALRNPAPRKNQGPFAGLPGFRGVRPVATAHRVASSDTKSPSGTCAGLPQEPAPGFRSGAVEGWPETVGIAGIRTRQKNDGNTFRKGHSRQIAGLRTLEVRFQPAVISRWPGKVLWPVQRPAFWLPIS